MIQARLPQVRPLRPRGFAVAGLAAAGLLIWCATALASTPGAVAITIVNNLSASAPDMPAYPQLAIRSGGQSYLWTDGDLADQSISVRRGKPRTIRTGACNTFTCSFIRSSLMSPLSWTSLQLLSREPALGWQNVTAAGDQARPMLYWQDTHFPDPTRGYMLSDYLAPTTLTLASGRAICVTAKGFPFHWPWLSNASGDAALTLTFTDTCPSTTAEPPVTAVPILRVTVPEGRSAVVPLSGSLPDAASWEVGSCSGGESIELSPAHGSVAYRAIVRRSGVGEAHCFARLVDSTGAVTRTVRIRMYRPTP